MRILLISDSYPPVLGGSEIEAQRVAAGLIQAGHKVQVICSGGPPMPPLRNWVDPAGVPVTILTRKSRGRWKDMAFAAEVARTIWTNRKRFDIVYFLMQGLHIAAGLPVMRLVGMPVVMKISGDGIISAMRRSRAGRLELGWLRAWRVPVMLLNASMFREAEDFGLSRSQLVWMPNPVDIEEFRPAVGHEYVEWRTGHGLPSDACVVVYVGRLSSEKGLPGLLRGFAVAARANPKMVLLLIGDGPQRAELESMTAGFGLQPKQVIFTGRVPVNEVPFWLRSADIFALTSPNEGFPCSLLEAMATGLPSVVSDIAANLQLVDEGVHGLTVGWDDGDAIGAALSRLAGSPADRLRMGEEARKRAINNYSMQRIVARYEDLFTKAMDSRSYPDGHPGIGVLPGSGI